MPYNRCIHMGMRNLLISSGTLALLAVPAAAFAATTDFFGPIIPKTGVCICDGSTTGGVASAMDWGCVIIVIQNVTNFMVSMGVLLVVLAIAWAGFTLIVSGSKPEGRTRAKNLFLNSVIGLVLVLGAWLIVDTIMKTLYNSTESGTGASVSFGPWNTILARNADAYCLKPNKYPGQLTTGTVSPGGIDAVVGGILNAGTTNSSGGSCTVPKNPSNPCSVQSLSNTCFAASGANASSVCNFESSGGNPNIQSGTDKLNGGNGPSYSYGLWQINLTTTPLKTPSGMLNCPAAFVGLNNPSNSTCGGGSGNKVGPANYAYCTVAVKPDAASQDLFKKCVAAAKVPEINTQAACNLYNANAKNGSTRGLQPWLNTSQRCNVPLHGA
jgi:hypothetical protein